MDRILDIDKHLQAMTDFQEALKAARNKGALSELDKRNDVYVRVNASGYRLVSLEDKTPLAKLSPPSVKTPEGILEHLRATPKVPCREVPEARVHAWIIRRAQFAGGTLLNVLQIPSSNYEELIFAFDEISPEEGIRCDILAIGRRKESYVPVVIELKYDRQQTELLRQLDAFSALIKKYPESFSQLFRARTGLSVDCSAPEKILVWPWSEHERKDKMVARENEKVLEVAYRLTGSIEQIEFQTQRSARM